MLGRILGATIFETSAREALAVISNAQQFTSAQPPIALGEIYVLVLRANPGSSAGLQISDSSLLIRAKGLRERRRLDAEEDGIGQSVALPVVIEKEKELFTDAGTAEVSAELVEVIRRFSKTFDFIDRVVGIQALVAKELKGRAVEIVSAGLGDHVDHSAASVAELSGICVGIDLEFLHRVFAELVRSTARSSAADGLAEEGVVVVRAIDDQGIESAALSGKADVAAAYVEGDTWSKEYEIDEVTTVCGEVFNGHIVHRGAHLTTGGFDDGGFIGDGDGLGLSSHREGEVQVQPGADTQRDVLLRQLGEARVLDFDRVGAYREDGEGEEAVGIASGLKVDACRVVGTGQLGARKSGTGLIDDDAFDGALIPLGPGGSGD